MRTITSMAKAKGNRPYQEDQAGIYDTSQGLILAVFDGHGGSDVSDFCIQHLVSAYQAMMEVSDLNTRELRLRALINLLALRTNEMEAGSTASIVAIPADAKEAVIGILGDSPVIIRQAGGTIWQTLGHNVRTTSGAELDAAKGRGGVIYGGYLYSSEGLSAAGLQMTRALGDKNLGNVLSHEPEIFTIPIDVDSWILVASDGLIDPRHGTADNTPNIIQIIEEGKNAKDLVSYALTIPTNDNVSAILVKMIN